jgi:putative FmdB family regulatory protein
MPIYAYKCASCGFAKDQLQKISDPALTDCPDCGQSTFTKQITAAGFQLKGSGWYATDFKGGSGSPSPSGTACSDTSPAATSASADTATASPSAGGCAPSCACH